MYQQFISFKDILQKKNINLLYVVLSDVVTTNLM